MANRHGLTKVLLDATMAVLPNVPFTASADQFSISRN